MARSPAGVWWPGGLWAMARVDGTFYIYYYGHMSIVTSGDGATIPVGLFKAKCLSLIDQVSRTHQVIIITKRGKPVARLAPLEEERPRSLYGFFSGHVVEERDIVSPTGEEWGAERG